mgnify:CR=1 FL=1
MVQITITRWEISLRVCTSYYGFCFVYASGIRNKRTTGRHTRQSKKRVQPMNKDEIERQEEIIKDGLRFYLACLENPAIPHPEIKARTAQYLHEKYNTGVLRAITLSHRIQGRFANMRIDYNNIPW